MTPDELRLLAIHRIIDGVGEIDLHERASALSTERGHDEPTDADYLDATREAMDVIVKAEFGVTASARTEALRIPEGWALVPLEPTVEQVVAAIGSLGLSRLSSDHHQGIYRAMLKAAPSLPSPLERKP